MKHVILTLGIMVVLLGIPFRNEVVINKSDITGNYAFVGDIELNGTRHFVGTDICCEYWLNAEEQPDVRTVSSTRLGVLGLLFGLKL